MSFYVSLLLDFLYTSFAVVLLTSCSQRASPLDKQVFFLLSSLYDKIVRSNIAEEIQ